MKPATFWQKQSVRLVAAWLLPLVVGLLQWNLARYFGPFPWFLFYQVAFLAPIIGGVLGGVGATLLSALCVWYFFLPPQLTFSLHKPGFPASVLVFIATGIGFTLYHREMRKRQERYRALFQEAGEGIVVVDSQGRFVDANDTFCTLTGRSRAEILAGSVMQFDIAMSPAVRSSADSQLAAAGVASFEGQIRRTDESLMRVEVTVTPLDGGQRLAIVRSVDERKRMENAMRQSEEKFAKFFHSSPIALAVFDLHDGRLVDVNEAFVKQFGYSREDAIGRTTYELGIVTQETQSAIIHLLETGGDLHHLEHTVICKSGEIKECLGAIEILN